MTSIYWFPTGGNAVRLKTYSATTKSTGETSIKIELTSADAHEAAWILQQLKDITDEQKAKPAPAPASSRRRSRRPDPAATAITADRPLQLTYRGDE